MYRLRSIATARHSAWVGAAQFLAVALTVQSAYAQTGVQAVRPNAAEPNPVDAQIAAVARTLDVSPSVVLQIQSLMDDKGSRTPAQNKISSQLLYAARMYEGLAAAPGVPILRTNVVPTAAGRVAIDVIATTVTDDLLSAVGRAGGSLVSSSAATGVVHADLPLRALEILAARDDVRLIRPSIPPQPGGNPSSVKTISRSRLAPYRTAPATVAFSAELTPDGLSALNHALLPALLRTGSVDSEGDTTHRAILARTRYGTTGAGVNVGVISDDVLYLDQLQANSDLPAVGIATGQSGLSPSAAFETGEGTAMLKIVHDIAPGARLFFASGEPWSNGFYQNILDLRFQSHCDIIIDDLDDVYEPTFSDGYLSLAVNQVTNDGALYFSACGNQGDLSRGTSSCYEGDFNSGGSLTIPGRGVVGEVHNYGTAASPILYNRARVGTSVFLFWADPFDASGNDYDLYVTDSTGTVLKSSSTDTQNGTQEPLEVATAGANDRIYVVRRAGATRALHLTCGHDITGGLALATTGQTRGQSSAVAAFAVAAAPATNDYGFGGPFPGSFSASSPTEYFSADGPRRMFFDVSPSHRTTAITPGNFLYGTNGGAVRLKPDIAAADGITTSVPGFAPFYGTSAAAPHAGAIAALLKSYVTASDPSPPPGVTVLGPRLTTAEMRTVLTSGTLDVDARGVDRDSGYGLVMPILAIQFLQNALLPKSVTISLVNASSFKISWTTTLPSVGYLQYGPTVATALTASGGPGASVNHAVTITGVDPARATYYRLGATTPSGSISYLSPSALPLNAVAALRANIVLANLALSRAHVNGQPLMLARLTLTNTGKGTANDVQISAATLGGLPPTAPTAILPVDLGALTGSRAGIVDVYFPAAPKGTAESLLLTGADGDGGTFTATVHVILP
jgi:hypothetical protein